VTPAAGGTVLIPLAGGGQRRLELQPAIACDPPSEPLTSRIAYAAAHVVGGPEGAIHWEATLAYRRHLWAHGLGVAEAMDTAQRGSGLNWELARELIERSVAEARAVGGAIACGAGTDQIPADTTPELAEVRAAYEEQCAFVEGQGAPVILMASRALARCAQSPDDYRAVYGSILDTLERPAILHWLGEMFDPNLRGYWGSDDLDVAASVVLELIEAQRDKVDGIKVSLLDADREVRLRRRLPAGVRLYTGDDFNYPALIRGDEQGYSDALLGIFDAIAPAAAAAIAALDRGDLDVYEETLAPTVPLARHLFAEPTYNYKTGIVFLAHLNGHQDEFEMLGGMQNARSLVHLGQLVVLADRAGLLRDPELAAYRARRCFAVAGVA
jgi:Protein of unknown function (DUF993)